MLEATSYEDAVAQLEAIVRKLEADGTSLDDSLKLFEEGVRLSRHCALKLDEAEKKVLVLTEQRDGSFNTTPFEPTES
ncbi:MAG: exodeoxyribonuclease VII small subunit [Myxococcota bacterium]